jgi:aryl-alcohol dehydrogenase-like predicted oxidoreductase
MRYNRLAGENSPNVSVICLGTMTWGQQNTEAEAFEQLDYALAHGVNLLDTAEVYPVPIKQETHARTERYIGNWLKSRGCREQVLLATKVAGPSERINWLRGTTPTTHTLDAANITAACEQSLKRLQTDVLDLYQVHWPSRSVNVFGVRDYPVDPTETTEALTESLLETLTAIDALVKAGKVRYVGLSNETAWGIMKAFGLCERHGLARPVTVQNAYNLLNRQFEVNTSEVSIREQIGLLAYSPLASGVLSGKYLQGKQPAGSRLALFSMYFDRYSSLQAEEAVQAYSTLAKEAGLTPSQLALAFVNTRPFLCSNLIGATSLPQLKENIESINTVLSPEVLTQLEAIHQRYPNPCP